MDWQTLLPVAGAIAAWLGFIEKRLADMRASFEDRIEDKNEINKVVQEGLQQDIARLESKIDMLIQLQFIPQGKKNE